MKFKANANSSLSCRSPIQKRSKQVKKLASVSQPVTDDTISCDFDDLYEGHSDKGDDDFVPDDIEMSPPPIPRLLSRKKSKFGASVDGDDAIGKCLQELKRVRTNVCSSEIRLHFF
jgi:hypothetical protein